MKKERTKKRIGVLVAVTCALTMVFATSAAVFAVPSPTQELPTDAVVTDGDGNTISVIVETLTEAQWAKTIKDPAVIDMILQVEENKITLKDAAEEMFQSLKVKDTAGDTIDLSKYDFLTTIMNFRFSDAKYQPDTNTFLVSWTQKELVGLSDANKPMIVHYDKEAAAWQLIAPSSVDYTTGKISGEFKDLSPVAVIYVSNPETTPSTDNNTPTTPEKTSSNATTYIVIAVIAILAVVFFIFMKKRKKGEEK